MKLFAALAHDVQGEAVMHVINHRHMRHAVSAAGGKRAGLLFPEVIDDPGLKLLF